MGIRSFWQSLGERDAAASPTAQRSIYFPSLAQLAAGGLLPTNVVFTQNSKREEEIQPTFQGYLQGAFTSGPVFACILARASLFSEARFQWRQFRDGRPGRLFGTPELEPLEIPWPNGTTGDLIVRLEQDYSLAGNFYGRRTRAGIDRMRPDWVTIVLGSKSLAEDPTAAIDAEIIGYIYHPGGRNSKHDPVILRVEEVCHFTGPTPDPSARFRGTSWLTSVLAEIQADRTGMTHKQRYLEEGGPNVAVSFDIPDPQEFAETVAAFKASEVAAGGYGKLFFNTGVPQTSVIGSSMVEADFKALQGAGETRIASAAGVPPIIVGFAEGLESATYSNYQLAMRRFADLTARPMWRMMASCFESVLEVPSGASLWYDDRDIAALKDDIVSRADVQTKQMAAAKLAFDAGFDMDTVVDYLNSDDIMRLTHSGATSVQNQNGSSNGQLPKAPEQAQLPPARAELAEFEEALRGAA